MYKVSNWFRQSLTGTAVVMFHKVTRSLNVERAWTTWYTGFVYYAAYLAVERETKTVGKDARFGAHFTQMYRFSVWNN